MTGAQPELPGHGSLPRWPGPPEEEPRKGRHVRQWLFAGFGILCLTLVVATVLLILAGLVVAYMAYTIFIKSWG
ncbi:MAG: hypothetical protein JO345_20485 [Streptosporangiaceae bacterium]|nr:hypothetical protein [Streptosporangiaceae bacterium]